jgi:hypothetical protein
LTLIININYLHCHLIIIIYIYPVSCLRRRSIIYVISLGCYGYVLLCVVVSLVRHVIGSSYRW